MPRLRGAARQRGGPYPLGQIPNAVLVAIGRQLVHRIAIGQSDITGDDFGTIFAAAISGDHRGKPLGVADVVLDSCAWSVKTVQAGDPFAATTLRLISGRNSPDYSLGIENPHSNPASTGRAVLAIWNGRVNEAMAVSDDLRIVVLVRNMTTRRFVIFEEEARRFIPDDFRWAFNKQGNLEGFDTTTGVHCFTWQPHGSQFTVLRDVPGSARGFSINRNVPMVALDTILASVGFSESWIGVR